MVVESEVLKAQNCALSKFSLPMHSNGVETSVPDSPLSFLVQSSQQDEIWWKGRTSADVADNPNRFSLAGLGVEKEDGKGTTHHSRSISFSEYGMANFFDCVFFEGESFVHASLSMLQLSVCFCSRFQ